jgi:glycosyltransferase involved in cell wall biosynthesis
MRIAIATDAWYPQPNGVVRVVGTVADRLARRGHDLCIISPDRFRTFPCPTYSELRLALLPRKGTASALESFAPNAIHIATEGPIGAAARRYCLRHGLPFTTAYHSKFPEFIHARTRLPISWLYEKMRRFHAPSSAVMVPSRNVHDELAARGFGRLKLWSHGVDTEVFKPGPADHLDDLGLERPYFMYVGRVTIDKNIPAFLDLDLPGSKIVVGSGPARDALMKRYPDVVFRIADGDAELARYFNAPDVFVFPSLTDTFGLVMLEALACGTPVAAFPVTGPTDVLGKSKAGKLDRDLQRAALDALSIDPDICRSHALQFSWDRVVDEFLSFLEPIARETRRSA